MMRKQLTAHEAVDRILATCREMDPAVVWSVTHAGVTGSTSNGTGSLAGEFTITIKCGDSSGAEHVLRDDAHALQYHGRIAGPLLTAIALIAVASVASSLRHAVKVDPTGWKYYVSGFPVEPAVDRAVHLGSLGLILAGVLIMVVVAGKWCRAWYRFRNGLCAMCGYDLRASKDGCPECGNGMRQPRPHVHHR